MSAVNLHITSCSGCPFRTGTGPMDGDICNYNSSNQFWLDMKSLGVLDPRCPLKK